MSQVERGRKSGLLAKVVPAVMESRRGLGLVVGALRVYQRSGLQAALRKSRALRALPGNLAEMESSLPAIQGEGFQANGQVIPALGQRRASVALLSGCVMPLVNGPQMAAAARVLARNGCDVAVPRGQVCCGAISSHVGDLDSARKQARRNIDVFLDAGVEAVVVASAGCGTRMKEYGHLLRRDSAYAGKAERLSEMVKDIHEFLVALPYEPPTARLDCRVTYQDSCHLANTQRITAQPRSILRSIPGVEFVELPNASRCCGGGRHLHHHRARIVAQGAGVQDGGGQGNGRGRGCDGQSGLRDATAIRRETRGAGREDGLRDGPAGRGLRAGGRARRGGRVRSMPQRSRSGA